VKYTGTVSKGTVILPPEAKFPDGTKVCVEPFDEGSAALLWPRWVQPTVANLLAMFELEPNWDSYQAAPVEKKSIESAVSLLLATMDQDSPPPAVVPTSVGGVQLEWHQGGVDLEIEVRPTGSAHVYSRDRQSGAEWEGEIPSDVERLRGTILTLSR
jgi:hypothetical protein